MTQFRSDQHPVLATRQGEMQTQMPMPIPHPTSSSGSTSTSTTAQLQQNQQQRSAFPDAIGEFNTPFPRSLSSSAIGNEYLRKAAEAMYGAPAGAPTDGRRRPVEVEVGELERHLSGTSLGIGPQRIQQGSCAPHQQQLHSQQAQQHRGPYQHPPMQPQHRSQYLHQQQQLSGSYQPQQQQPQQTQHLSQQQHSQQFGNQHTQPQPQHLSQQQHSQQFSKQHPQQHLQHLSTLTPNSPSKDKPLPTLPPARTPSQIHHQRQQQSPYGSPSQAAQPRRPPWPTPMPTDGVMAGVGAGQRHWPTSQHVRLASAPPGNVFLETIRDDPEPSYKTHQPTNQSASHRLSQPHLAQSYQHPQPLQQVSMPNVGHAGPPVVRQPPPASQEVSAPTRPVVTSSQSSSSIDRLRERPPPALPSSMTSERTERLASMPVAMPIPSASAAKPVLAEQRVRSSSSSPGKSERVESSQRSAPLSGTNGALNASTSGPSQMSRPESSFSFTGVPPPAYESLFGRTPPSSAPPNGSSVALPSEAKGTLADANRAMDEVVNLSRPLPHPASQPVLGGPSTASSSSSPSPTKLGRPAPSRIPIATGSPAAQKKATAGTIAADNRGKAGNSVATAATPSTAISTPAGKVISKPKSTVRPAQRQGTPSRTLPGGTASPAASSPASPLAVVKGFTSLASQRPAPGQCWGIKRDGGRCMRAVVAGPSVASSSPVTAAARRPRHSSAPPASNSTTRPKSTSPLKPCGGARTNAGAQSRPIVIDDDDDGDADYIDTGSQSSTSASRSSTSPRRSRARSSRFNPATTAIEFNDDSDSSEESGTSEEEDVTAIYCHQHSREINKNPGFHHPSTSAFISFDKYLPSTLPVQVAARLRTAMVNPLSQSDKAERGYIYVYEVLDFPAPSSLLSSKSKGICLKIGRSKNPLGRVAQWRSQCSSKQSVLRGLYPSPPTTTTALPPSSSNTNLLIGSASPSSPGIPGSHLWERLIHLELSSYSLSLSSSATGGTGTSTATGTGSVARGDGMGKCRGCGKRHRELFWIPLDVVSSSDDDSGSGGGPGGSTLGRIGPGPGLRPGGSTGGKGHHNGAGGFAMVRECVERWEKFIRLIGGAD